jgi:predicted nucleotidyltransferase
MAHLPIAARYEAALDALVAELRADRAVLAAILCGSLSHDTVWAGSDIDLVLVTIDDRKVKASDAALYADGVNVHALLVPRAEFRAMVEGSRDNSFVHAFLARGRLLYTHDETIADLCARLREIGERDTRVQLLRAAIEAVGPLYKARKWLVTRGDLDYTALWILYAATPLARIEVVGRRLVADREVIPQATALNPSLFRIVYTDVLNERKTRASVERALAAAEGYLAERAPALFAPVLAHLAEVGEARSCSEIEDHFRRTLDVEGVALACEYLADRGLVGKASTPLRLTRRSTAAVQELAFVHRDGGAEPGGEPGPRAGA